MLQLGFLYRVMRALKVDAMNIITTTERPDRVKPGDRVYSKLTRSYELYRNVSWDDRQQSYLMVLGIDGQIHQSFRQGEKAFVRRSYN